MMDLQNKKVQATFILLGVTVLIMQGLSAYWDIRNNQHELATRQKNNA